MTIFTVQDVGGLGSATEPCFYLPVSGFTDVPHVRLMEGNI